MERTGFPTLETGQLVGQFKNEVSPDKCIVEFTAAAPKCYMYKTVNNEDETELGFTFKVKGIPLNSRNTETINPKVLLETILEKPTNVISINNPSKICRDKHTATLST